MTSFSKHFILLFIPILFFSCTSLQTGWIKDASNMRREVQKEKKSAFILFTGSDWDIPSGEFLAKKLDGKLISKYGKDFLFYNIDILRNEDEANSKILKMNYLLFSKYEVKELPYIAVRSYEGDIYFSSKLDNENSIDSLMKSIIEKGKKIESLKGEIKKTSGKDKTIAINNFFSSIYNGRESSYDVLREEAVASDPENKSGLLGQFKWSIASLKAERLALQKQYLKAVDEYIILLKEGYASDVKYIDAKIEQNVWYEIALLYALSKKIENAKVIQCLENAIKADPNSTAVPHLKEIIGNIKK